MHPTGEGIMTTRAELSAAEEDEKGHSRLMREALHGNTEEVQKLIDQGAEVNQKDHNGRTALMFAVINSHYETVKMLLEHGADVNVRSNGGGTALMGAASAGDLRTVQALLDHGADLEPRLPDTNESAATLAASHGHEDVARLLSTKDRTHDEGA